MFDAVLDLPFDAIGFGVGDRRRLIVGTQEPGDLRRVLDQMMHFVREVALHQNVTGEKLSFGIHFSPATDFDHLFGRDQDLGEFVFKTAMRGLLTNGFDDLLFEVRIGVNDVPAHAHLLSPKNPRDGGGARFFNPLVSPAEAQDQTDDLLQGPIDHQEK